MSSLIDTFSVSVYALNSLLKPSFLKVTEALVRPREKVLKLRAKNSWLCSIKKMRYCFNCLLFMHRLLIYHQRGSDENDDFDHLVLLLSLCVSGTRFCFVYL